MSATRETAEALWGADVVTRALGESAPAPVTIALVTELETVARDGPERLARWALALPWPVFCTVVRVCTGDTVRDLVTAPN